MGTFRGIDDAEWDRAARWAQKAERALSECVDDVVCTSALEVIDDEEWNDFIEMVVYCLRAGVKPIAAIAIMLGYQRELNAWVHEYMEESERWFREKYGDDAPY